MKRTILIHISIILAIILSSCATDYKRWPSGGIDDRVSPTITFYTPQEGSLNQDKNITAKIEFSEFIDHNSTRNAITIFPYSVQQKSKIIWYEKSVKIEFSDLKKNQTVLIALNTSLSDMRKNNIKTNFILNFSTGEKIDKKELSGHINGAIIGENIEQMNYSKLKVNLYRNDLFSFYEINNINPEYSVGISDD
ncbi:MAG: Ig-like domain-containing protein, partial [Candidatus Delongbacteria bacterium]|nr:Ig-like domain-containing protein [Candidatus Delongbacteria bacterium]